MFQGCQRTVYAYADRNQTTGVATWTEPIAIDNHDINVVVQKETSSSPSPGDRLSAGSYKIVYKAVDAAGNKAQSCETEVVLRGIKQKLLSFSVVAMSAIYFKMQRKI